MASRSINVLITSFGGTGLPPTSNIVCSDAVPLQILQQKILEALPPVDTRIFITTQANKQILPLDVALSALLPDKSSNFLPLRLSVPLCGGKGGFGSQLRAAGGRMSSKRKKSQGENNSSNRNLDGRRLRTVKEAKALAEYLALRPEMDMREREARRKRWEQVVDLAERREDEIRSYSRGRVDGKWAEDKEEVSERTRDAVFAAMKRGDYRDDLSLSLENIDEAAGRSPKISGKEGKKPSPSGLPSSAIDSTRNYIGFDEDDEYMSYSGDDAVRCEDEVVKGKGKGKAV